MSNLGFSIPAKCLLFGEYTILKGGDALAIPLEMFKGSLELHQQFSDSHKSIQLLAKHLKEKRSLLPEANYDLLAKDLEQGLSFQSNIPIGYGIGSSGSLVAALFKRYFYSQDSLGLMELKNYLGVIESFFHGNSSGVDPLISYVQKDLFFNLEKVEAAKIYWPENLGIFLINSRVSRKTNDLVKIFEKKAQDTEFNRRLEENLMPLNNKLISEFLNPKKSESFWKDIQLLSRYQLESFSEMIPYKVQRLMQNLLTESHSAMKLCGAGGGGFFLGFSQDKNKLESILKASEGIDFKILR